MRWPDMTDVRERGIARREKAQEIVRHARQANLNANLTMVLRRFDLWSIWHEGRYSTGYLMRQTGVRRITDAQIR